MPKVKVNNTQGLVQATGGGIALFGATEAISDTNTIAATTSLVLYTTTGASKILSLPAVTNLETGHTIVIGHIAGSNNATLRPTPTSLRMNGVNSDPELTLTAKTAVKCIWSGSSNPGWIVIVGDASTVPA